MEQEERPSSARDDFERHWQPRLWVTLGLLILIGAYLIAFVVANDEEARVDFVLDRTHGPLILELNSQADTAHVPVA